MSKILTGVVVSNKMSKTIVVDVARKFQHPRFRKIVNIHKKFKVHLEEGTVEIGSVVTIQETKPISKDKHFVLIGTPIAPSTKTRIQTAPSSDRKIEKEVKELTESKSKEKAEATIEKPEKKTVKKTAVKKTTKTVKKTATKTAKKKVTNSKK